MYYHKNLGGLRGQGAGHRKQVRPGPAVAVQKQRPYRAALRGLHRALGQAFRCLGMDVLEYLDVAAAIGFDPCKLIRILGK
jgi:hypothetical protein